MNILICSAGRRVKLVQYFKEELSKLGGKVVAIDCDATAPALRFADFAEIVPAITNPEYLLQLKQLCQKHEIDAVLSLIDPELSVLAEQKENFEKENIRLIVSSKEIVDICFDKYRTYKFLEEHHLPGIPTYINLNKIISEIESGKLDFPIIVKPKNGSASIGISIVNSLKELLAVWRDSGELIAQPFMDGDEYGIDCYIDLLNASTTNIFCKKKIKMRAGETDKSLSVNDPSLIHLIEELIRKLNPVGPIDIDCFKTEKGYFISEINPRFGGGYPHAHEAGQNFIKNMINNLAGTSNKADIGNYSGGSVMIKFDDVILLPSLDKSLKLIHTLQTEKGGIACTR
ncbi:ATP-grasp domain-containing protein [Neobacillus cucumis]|uniref:Carbamoylphosphate synthase large subunit n=1 Tax=Neobacillus cucumis TaxID=1740721 RepID=A0A2N5H6H4_9BACI|nr:ATP-grasp domain-containing protein [Neobacillus cucumis]PLS01099.1 carbamoylphosphate synthase large subunit [Neobacillus cucumis]